MEIECVEKFVKKHNMISEHQAIVVGVSGGADSMCLLDILIKMRKKYDLAIYVVHVHHGIRGKEADEDMEFVQKFCEINNTEFLSFKYNIQKIALELNVSVEEAGRIKRYEAFEQVLFEKDRSRTGKIAVAHNRDDSGETFLLNLFRGSGIKGLTGIAPVRGKVIRPVLCLKRKDIEKYLRDNDIEYRTDKTNLLDDYTRNKIRLNVIPYVKNNINDRAVEHIEKTAEFLCEIDSFLNKMAEDLYKEIVIEKEDSIEIRINDLEKNDKVLIKMVIRMAVGKTAGKLKDVTAVHIENILDLKEKKVGSKCDLPYDIQGEKGYEGIIIGKYKENKEKSKVSKELDISSVISGNIISESGLEFSLAREEMVDLTENLYIKYMDYDILKDNLSLRNRRTGDYMTIGKNGEKKSLKKLLIELKIPQKERDELLLLALGSEIVWIVGYRMGEICKVKENTKNIVKVRYCL